MSCILLSSWDNVKVPGSSLNWVANNQSEGNLGEEWYKREAVGEREEGHDGLWPQ